MIVPKTFYAKGTKLIQLTINEHWVRSLWGQERPH